MKRQPVDRHIGVGKAADYLGVHRTTIFRYVQAGLLNPDGFLPNGDKRFKVSTLERFLQGVDQGADQ